MHPDRLGLGAATNDDDHRTALRFVLGRPGWRVEAPATTRGRGAYLKVTTPCSKACGQGCWRVERTQQGILVHDEISGRRLGVFATVREALVEVWETVTGAAPD